MASRSLGTLTLDLVAKTGGFTAGLTKAEREARKSSKKIQDNLVKIGTAGKAAASAIVVGSAIIVKQMTAQADEIDRFSRLASASTDEFQKLSYASQSYGVTSEKLADILKDTNDKFGDFNQNAAGPLKDFFDNIAPKVGVTAEQFRTLSGPQALQLYVNSLERANLSQQDMTFYMEAIANDAKLLLPVLSENGKRYKELSDQAERYGVILSEKTIKESILFERQLDRILAVAQGLKVQLGSELLPTTTNLGNYFLEFAENSDVAAGIIERLGSVFDLASIAGIALLSTFENLSRAMVGLTEATGQAIVGNFSEAGKIIDDFTAKNEAAAARAEEAMGRIWRGESADTSNVDTNNNNRNPVNLSPIITEADKKQASALKESIMNLNEMVATIGMTNSEIEIYKLRLQGASEAQIQFAKDAYALRDAYEAQEAETKKNKDAVDEQIKSLNEMLATLGMTESQIELYTLRMNGASEAQLNFAKDALDVRDAFKKQEEAAQEAQEQMKRSAEQFASNTQDIFADFLFDPFDDGLSGMVDSFATMLQRMAAEAAAAEIFQNLFGGAGGSGGGGGFLSGLFSSGGADAGTGSFLSSIFGGARATGGNIWPGSIYEAGEFNRPELMKIGNDQFVIPGNKGGMITPMSQAGGARQVVQQFNITTPNPDGFRLSERQIKRRAKQGLA